MVKLKRGVGVFSVNFYEIYSKLVIYASLYFGAQSAKIKLEGHFKSQVYALVHMSHRQHKKQNNKNYAAYF